MSCEQFLQALGDSDVARTPELAEHVRACSQCRALWQADQQLTAASRRSHPGVPMSLGLRRALAEAPASVRTSSPRLRALLVCGPLALVLGAGVFLLGRADLRTGLALPFWCGALFLSVCLAASIGVYLHRDATGHALPAHVRWLGVIAAVSGFELFAWLNALHTLPPDGAHARNDCLLFGLIIALALGAAALFALRRSVLTAAAASGALAGCIGGLAAVSFLHLHCAAASGWHVQVVHGLPLAIAIAIGVWASRRGGRCALEA